MADGEQPTHEELLRKDLDDAWSKMLGTEGGRLILWSILDQCKLFSFPHHGDSTDALLRGRQQVGAHILHEFVFPNGVSVYTDMLLEAEERGKRIDFALDAKAAESS